MSLLQIILMNFGVSLLAFLILWAISIRIRNASIVDIFWGPACALPAATTWLQMESHSVRATLITVLVLIWGLRLGMYLGVRNVGHGEDFRYVRMREKAGGDGPFVVRSLTHVFIMQCCISFFVSLPVQVGQFGTSQWLDFPVGPLGLLACLGLAVFAIGLTFEAVGDHQLRQFKKDPANKGKLMDRGLWAWTRHPNYFGDAAVWIGLTLIALESQWGILTVLSPLLMIHFLYNLSGKALLERSMARRYSDYEDYRRRVSGFLPRPPAP
jgi:steroid 5-alpha reductase family enzyme